MDMSKKDKEEVLKRAKEQFKLAKEGESDFRKRIAEDFRFRAGQQWPDQVKRMRENDPEGARPCLVMDKTNQYVRQVVNDYRQNRPAIKVRPVDSGADKETAEILQGIIRHIEDVSKADVAYESALDSSVTCGIGWFRILTEVTDEATNAQEIRIARIPNALSVYATCDWSSPDGDDIKELFITDKMSKDEFKRKYPKVDVKSWEAEEDWNDDDSVMIAEYYCVKESSENLLEIDDGSEIEEGKYWEIYAGDTMPDNVQRPAIIGTREKATKVVYWYKLTCGEILDFTEIPCQWIPVIPVIGNEMWVDGKRELTGMIRWVMDAQRAYNYGRSAFMEQVALAPKAPWVAADGQVEDYMDEWGQSNVRNIAVLRYRPTDVAGSPVPPPQRQIPPQPSAGWLQEMQLAQNDIQAALGMYSASVGAPSNEKSGRAIMARQREGDTSTYHYIDNLSSRSMRHAGRIMIDMIPKVYDTNRIIRILGEDGSPSMVSLNPALPVASRKERDESGEIRRIFNPTIGKYDVSVTVGPAYTTKRQEAADAMVEMTRGNPQLMAVVGDLMVESMDWPMSDRIAKRLRALLPDQVKQAEVEDDDVEQRVQMAVQQAAQQFQQQFQEFQQSAMEAMQELQQENAELKQKAEAKQGDLMIDAAKLDLDNRKVAIDEYKAETERAEKFSQMMTPEQVQAIVFQTIQDLIMQGNHQSSPQEMHGILETNLPPESL